MREPEIPSDPDRVACKVCFKEIPLSEAVNEEATDYVLHFCGLDCYAKWKAREKGYGSGDSLGKKLSPLKGRKGFSVAELMRGAVD